MAWSLFLLIMLSKCYTYNNIIIEYSFWEEDEFERHVAKHEWEDRIKDGLHNNGEGPNRRNLSTKLLTQNKI